MNNVLEFFRLNDFLALLLLVGLLEFVGGRMGNSSTIPWFARGIAAAGFLLYAGCAIAEWKPRTAADFLMVGLRAVLAMGVVHGVSVVVLPALHFLLQYLWIKPIARHQAWSETLAQNTAMQRREQEEAQRKREELQKRAEAERHYQKELARRPPPPTRDELLAAAKARYDGTLRLLAAANLDAAELQAGQLRAKQRFLCEIEGLIK